MTVTDDDQASDTKSVSSVVNAAPVVSAGPDVSGSEGSAISLAGGVTDADSKATAQWSYAAGPGVDAGASCSFADASAASTTITCTDDGSYTVTLTGDDLTNPAVSDTAVVTVGNVAPSVTISAPASGTVFPAASAVSVTASYTDAGANDTHTCSINWGDGTTTAGTVNASATPRTCTGSMTYAAAGSYTIQVTVTDDDQASDTKSVNADVNAPP